MDAMLNGIIVGDRAGVFVTGVGVPAFTSISWSQLSSQASQLSSVYCWVDLIGAARFDKLMIQLTHFFDAQIRLFIIQSEFVDRFSMISWLYFTLEIFSSTV